jgi:thiamine biosynthesis protein ThiS
MKVMVNGCPHTHEGDGSLAALLKELNAQPEQVAVMVNDRVIPKAERTSIRLRDGDRVEVMTFMGGG